MAGRSGAIRRPSIPPPSRKPKRSIRSELVLNLSCSTTLFCSPRRWGRKLASPKKPIATLSGHSGPVYTAAFDNDGDQVLSASADGTARIWSVATRTERSAVGSPGVPINDASFSRDGKRIVTANENGTATIWSTELAGPLDRIKAIAQRRLAQIGRRSQAGT